MPNVPFDPNLHLKVRYNGNQYLKYRKKLFIVHLKDYEFEKMRDEEFVIIHALQFGIVNYNKSDTAQPIFVARKSELTTVRADVNE